MTRSILTIPDGIFNDWPIRYTGNLINPLFDSESVIGIVGRSHVICDTVMMDETSLYKYLELVSNEFSCKLFCVIVEKLNWMRLIVANEISLISPFNSVTTNLKNKCKMASLMLKKYQLVLKNQCLLAEEDKELSHLLANMNLSG